MVQHISAASLEAQLCILVFTVDVHNLNNRASQVEPLD